MSEASFETFCVQQANRLSVFPAWSYMNPIGQHEFIKTLQRCANRDMVAAIIDETVGRDDFPTIAELRRIRDRLFPAQPSPPAPVAAASCPDCQGSGYMAIRVGAYEGSRRCRCGGLPPQPTVEKTPVLGERPARADLEHAGAAIAGIAGLTIEPAPPKPHPLERVAVAPAVTQADIDEIKRRQFARASFEETRKLLAPQPAGKEKPN